MEAGTLASSELGDNLTVQENGAIASAAGGAYVARDDDGRVTVGQRLVRQEPLCWRLSQLVRARRLRDAAGEEEGAGPRDDPGVAHSIPLSKYLPMIRKSPPARVFNPRPQPPFA